MKQKGIEELGKVYGKHRIWNEGYLPKPDEDKRRGVLSSLLQNEDYEIESLDSFCKDYSKFYESYIPPKESKKEDSETNCDVPYWTERFWKTEKRIVVFGQKSKNEGEASVPLFSPLFEIDSWKKALKAGSGFNKSQNDTYGWKSFMLNWLTIRILFSRDISALKQVYYTDTEKFGNDTKKSDERNEEFLKQELEITKPGFIITLGKVNYNKHSSVLKEYMTKNGLSNNTLCKVKFPSGCGARNSEIGELEDCGKKLHDWLK